ncbi:hypothetical protein TrRE_jg13168, partial [Triparma retinervis]
MKKQVKDKGVKKKVQKKVQES